jgi:cation diffusion facilitator family transporter
MNEKDKRLGLLEGILSMIVNVILFGFKMWAGIVSGSVAMVADAWHTLSDSLTSLVVIIGFWISGKPNDYDHPFGHGRAELIGGLIIGVLLGVVGFNFLKESYLTLRGSEAAEFSTFGIIVFSVSVIVKEGLAQFSFWAGKKINSTSLRADGWHHRSDAIASLLIVIGALLGSYFWWIDGVLGLFVSVLLLKAAYDILKTAADNLMGETVPDEMIDEINTMITRIAPDASHSHHFHMHRYGDHKEVTMHLRFPDNYTIQDAHVLITKIEEEARDRIGVELTIHLEPE